MHGVDQIQKLETFYCGCFLDGEKINSATPTPANA